jgi:dTMP kinase
VLDLEYNIFQIPKPDFTLILNVTAEISQSLGKKRNLKEWLGKTKDIHEDDLNHLKKAEKTYLELAKIHKNTELIQCVENGAMLSREEIHEKIWKVLNA